MRALLRSSFYDMSAGRPTRLPFLALARCTDALHTTADLQVVAEMGKELAARGVGPDEVAVRGSSHFGGHRFAGVLIIYPQGDW